MYNISLNIIDITWRARTHWDNHHLLDIPYEELRLVVLDIAEVFEKKFGSEIEGKDYATGIQEFTDKCLAAELWRRFGDIPMNPETECIEEAWNGFSAGTFREDIWHWFEETFSVSVAVDLMHVG